jgi:hypothetical protein
VDKFPSGAKKNVEKTPKENENGKRGVPGGKSLIHSIGFFGIRRCG